MFLSEALTSRYKNILKYFLLHCVSIFYLKPEVLIFLSFLVSFSWSLLNLVPSVPTCQRANVPTWSTCQSTCQRACVPAWFTYQRACVLVWFTYQPVCVPTRQKRANFLFLRANVPINVATSHTACQCFKLACQRAKGSINFSNIPFTKCYCKFLYSIMIKKIYIILDIIVTYVFMMYRT